MRDDSKLMKASLWLQEVLADGQKAAAEVRSAATHAGHSAATLRRARERLAVEVIRRGFGETGRWYWRLPGGGKDAQVEHLTCSETDGIGDDLAGFSFDLEEPALDTGQDFTLSAADLDYLSRLPVPAPRRRR
jgi:hypothetical protein